MIREPYSAEYAIGSLLVVIGYVIGQVGRSRSKPLSGLVGHHAQPHMRQVFPETHRWPRKVSSSRDRVHPGPERLAAAPIGGHASLLRDPKISASWHEDCRPELGRGDRHSTERHVLGIGQHALRRRGLRIWARAGQGRRTTYVRGGAAATDRAPAGPSSLTTRPSGSRVP